MGSGSRTQGGGLSSRNPPKTVFRRKRLNIRVPVFEGTGVRVLNRGVGWTAGTARQGELPTSA
jgi:hypothetical protein